MSTIHQLLRGAGRFAVGLGIGLALTSAVVIICDGPALDAGDVSRDGRPAEIVRVDPPIVTIAPAPVEDRHAETDAPAPRFHLYGSGAQKV